VCTFLAWAGWVMFGLVLVGCASNKKTNLAQLSKPNFLAEVVRLRRQKRGGGVLRSTSFAPKVPPVFLTASRQIYRNKVTLHPKILRLSGVGRRLVASLARRNQSLGVRFSRPLNHKGIRLAFKPVSVPANFCLKRVF
jgi:hypothetical protein